MLISEIMVNEPLTLSREASLREAVDLMGEHGIHHLPITQDDKIIGVLSDRDLLISASKLGRTEDSQVNNDPLRVHSVMCPNPLTVTPEATLAEAARVLCEWGIGCLPVTREDQLVGFVTETDLLDAFVGSNLYGRLDDASNPKIEESMRREPVSVSADTTFEIAMELMHRGDFRHLPITDNANKPVGIVSDRDLRRAIGEGRAAETRVLEIGSSPPSTALPGETLARAAQRMAHERIGAQPVVNASNELIGILTITDILEHIGRI